MDNYTDIVVSDSPVAYWRLNETSGTVANDYVGSDDGTYTGSYTLNKFGIRSPGSAVGINNSYIELPNRNIGTSLTYEIVFRRTSGSATANLFSYMGQLIRITSSSISWWHDTAISYVTVSAPILLNNWYHLVVTQTGTSYNMYLNGALIDSAELSSSPRTLLAYSRIGAYTTTANFIGDIDEFVVYDHVLSPERVTAHYEALTSTAVDYSGVISNFDDVSPSYSGTPPTISAVGRTGNGAVYTGAGHKNFYFDSMQITRDNSRVYSAWVKSIDTNTNLVGLSVTSPGVNNNGYQFFIDNRNGTDGTTGSLQIRRDASTSAVLASYGKAGLIENGKWYRIEIMWRATAPTVFMKVYDENDTFIAQLGATDTTYNSSTMYLAGYGHGEVVIDDIEELSSNPTTKLINYAGTNNGYKHRKKLTVDGTRVTGYNESFVALVSMTDPDLRTTSNGGKVHKSPLLDVRFEWVDGTKLSHQVEKHVDATGEIIAWVLLPYMDAGTEFYMYYGKTLETPMSDRSWGAIDTVGIRAGVISSNITAQRDANTAAGAYNLGELWTYGNSVVGPDGAALSISDTNGYNTGQESGSAYYGYFMYHTAATASRFSGATKRANFALVTYDGTNWKYDNNSTLVNFTPHADDLLVAKIKWGGSAGFECFQTLYAGEEDVSGLWHWSQFRGVYHMESPPDGSSSTFEQVDSCWYSHPGSSIGSMNSADLVAGKIHTAIDFDGSNDAITLLDTAGSMLRLTTNMTISMWIYPRTGGTRRNIVGKAYGGEYEITQEINNQISTYWGRSGLNSGTSGATNGYQGFNSTHSVNLNQWNHVVVSRKVGSGGWVRIYINGVLSNSVTPLYTSAVSSTINTTIGTGRLSTAWFNGLMDELRFSAIGRDDSWIKTEYQNQNSPGNFYTLSARETFTPVRKFDGTTWSPLAVKKIL